MIQWHKSFEGHVSSYCGRFHISPLYWGCVNPQGYELHYRSKGGLLIKIPCNFDTQTQAKIAADKHFIKANNYER